MYSAALLQIPLPYLSGYLPLPLCGGAGLDRAPAPSWYPSGTCECLEIGCLQMWRNRDEAILDYDGPWPNDSLEAEGNLDTGTQGQTLLCDDRGRDWSDGSEEWHHCRNHQNWGERRGTDSSFSEGGDCRPPGSRTVREGSSAVSFVRAALRKQTQWRNRDLSCRNVFP